MAISLSAIRIKFWKDYTKYKETKKDDIQTLTYPKIPNINTIIVPIIVIEISRIAISGLSYIKMQY